MLDHNLKGSHWCKSNMIGKTLANDYDFLWISYKK